MALPQFIFGGDTGMTPEQLKKNRAVADALFRTASRTPQNVGEGISAIGQALAYRIREGQNEKAEKAIGDKQREISGTLGQQYAAALGGGSDFGAGVGYGSATGTISDASPTPSGSMVAASDLKPYQAALLDTISGPESAGAYDVIYGGSKFADFSDHPRKAVPIGSGPNQGKTSSAAGRYQFLGSTWDQYRDKLGLQDFSPANQDRAAYALASDTYRQKTGQDLDAVLQSGDPQAIASVGKVLNGVWTSLPGGIEQGTNTDRFVSAFSSSLGRYAGGRPSGGSAPVQVASLDPSAGVAEAMGPAPIQPGNVLHAPGAMSPEDQRLYDERIRGRGAQPDPAGAVPYAGPGARIDDPNAMQGTMSQQDYAAATDPKRMMPGSAPLLNSTRSVVEGSSAGPDAKNMAVARALGIQPQPITPPAMSPVAAALNGQPVATPTPRPEQTAVDPAPGGDAWAGLRPQDIARQNGNLQVAQASAGQPSPFDVARANGQTIETDAPTYMGRSVDTFDPQRLIGILQNEWASDEQKGMAMDILKLQGQRQQAAQAQRYKAWETQQGWAREDRRHAIEDRREDIRLRMEVDQANAPIEVGGVLVDRRTMQPVYQAPQQPFTLQPGETRFDGAGNQIAAGGAKPGYRTLTPEEVGRLGLPKGSYQVSPEGKVEDIGNKGQTINVGGGENKQVFDAMAESAAAARSAATGLNALTEAKSALDAGIISGAGADWNLGLQKIGAALGVVDPTVIQNTETFRASIAPQVAAVMKATVGSANISNSDREFAEKAAGGSINLDAGSIRRLVDIMDRASRAAIQSHLERLDAVYPGGGQFERERALFGVRMPKALSVPDRAGSAPPAQVPAQAPQQMPTQAAPPQQAPAQTLPGRQRWDRGTPSPRPAAPPPGEYRWNPATRRMEAM